MLQRDFNQPGDSSSQSTIPDLFPDFERLLQTKIEVSPPRPIPLRAPQPPRLWKLEIKSNEAGGYNASLEFEDGTKVEDTTVSPDPSLFEVRAWLDRYRESFGETAGAATRVEVAQKLRAAGEKMLPLLFPPRLDAEFTARFQNRPAQIHLSLPREWESIPWEYLADEEGYYLPQVPLYFSRAVKIETKPSRRGGTLPPTSELPALALPLRLLIVVSSPLDLNEDMQLDSDREVRQIRNALAEAIRQGEVVLELEDEANRERLKETLTRFKPHILHFSGHGYNTAQGLVWEGADGNTKRKDAPTAENPHQKVADPLDASAFADLLREQPQLRLLVLSACRSAERGTGGAFESVAEGLISRGVAPAVVAMQDSILDESGILFARHFYTNLSLGKAVEVALAEARREMEASGPDGQRGLEWGLPNHLTNRPGAALFSFDRLESFTPEVKRKGFNLVKLGNYFVGRQPELRKGRAALVGDQKRVVIITGPGGFGKSALAEKLLERTDYAFKTVFGVDCKRWQGLDIFLTTIATGLAEEGYHQLLIETLKKEQSLENKINALVEALNAGPHLLLLDNFEDLLNLNQDPYRPGGAKAEQYSEAVNLEGFLLELHKGLERGKLLITCRYDFEFTPQDRGAKEIEWLPLKKLSWREAEKIMLSNELGQLGRAQRRELYDKGAQSPIMFDWLAKEAASGKLAALIAEMTRLNQKFSDEFLLENLYQQLDPRGQALLRRGAVYRKAVPEEFWSRQQSKANLQPLLRRSLIYSEGEAYQLHESVRQFALNKLNENQAEFREAHLQAGQHFQYYAQNTEYNFLDLLEAKDHYLAAKAFPDAAELIQDLFPALDRAGLWRFTLGLLEELEHKLAESRADLPSNLAAWQLIYRGLLLNDLAGASKAIPLYEAALLLAREAGNIQTEAAVLGNLGNAYSSLGDYPKAIEYQEKRLGIAKEIGDRLGEGQVYGNLGVAYLSLGDYPKAIENGVRSSLIMLQIQSPHIRQVLNILKKVRGKIGLGELERVAAEVCGRLGVEYAQYRQLLEQGGVFAENSGQPGRLNEQLQGVAKTIGFALSGNEVALKNLTEQILPQLERMESGFEKLADFLHRLLAREIAPEAFQEELGALAETDRAIIALAFETARKATNEAESGDKQTENPGKDGLSEPHQQLALTIGQALRGNQEARKLLEQLLPQMENEESGFANLAGLVRLFLAGEQDQTKLQAAAANLDDTDRAIIQLAIQTAQGQADPPPSPSSREAEPQEQVVEQFISLLIAAAGGNEEAREQVQPVLDTMAEDKNTRKLAARLEMLLEGERNPESLTRGLSENENALIRAILEKLD